MSKKYSLSTNQISASESKHKIILDFDKGNYYSLNMVGAFIWDELKEQSLSLEEIIHKVVETFDITVKECENDLHVLLEDLQKEKLLIVSE
ncbi:PqqD family protein [Lacihabitans soyangensis]|uniref:PqqD family protein n=1 Tax=Lacihabitans soyangensis TaxID=869394 RepID=A0AAE3KTG0_9BACT|nr:PqqD family protein [Lacihabitans soyangensis]MCP9763704.1 PqqD family protein [Lacihabitans soyangensis]